MNYFEKSTGREKDLISFSRSILSPQQIGNIQTKNNLRQAIRNLKEFKQESKSSLHLDSINLDFYDQFMEFLIKGIMGKIQLGLLLRILEFL
jgi:hypothetical protein